MQREVAKGLKGGFLKWLDVTSKNLSGDVFDTDNLAGIITELKQKSENFPEIHSLVCTFDLKGVYEANSACVKLFDDARVVAQHLKKLADVPKSRFALINATRWHSSVYVAYKFLLERLYDVIQWLHEEDPVHTLPKSGKDLLELLDTTQKVELVKQQLEAYVDVYGPLAAHMNRISDGSRAFPVAVEIYTMETNLTHQYTRKLDALKIHGDESWRKVLLERIVDGLAYLPDRGDCLDMWKAIRSLDPRRIRTSPHLMRPSLQRRSSNFPRKSGLSTSSWLEIRSLTLKTSHASGSYQQ